jgi:hypothetical protein
MLVMSTLSPAKETGKQSDYFVTKIKAKKIAPIICSASES